MKARHDWSEYEGILPSSSELYGIYQPLLGWKSRLATERLRGGLKQTRDRLIGSFAAKFNPRIANTGAALRELRIEPGAFKATGVGHVSGALDTSISRRILAEAERLGPDNPDTWKRVTTPDMVQGWLSDAAKDIAEEVEHQTRRTQFGDRLEPRALEAIGKQLAGKESQVAGLIMYFAEKGETDSVRSMLHSKLDHSVLEKLVESIHFIDPERSELLKAVISPIGILHIFRQFFFELDSFLGAPVQHIWLSPGGSVTLVEASTRRQLIERSAEQSFDMTRKAETATMAQDELSDAVRDENTNNTKLGVGVDQSFSYGAGPVFSGSTNASADFSIENGTRNAREHVHKGLRQQSEKLSSEIRRSYKTTFRTVVETIDTQSKSYVLQNITGNLVNYEMRRKMRRVGVQLQDYGTNLCWQTYVDEPGSELGIGLLVHIAEPPELEKVKEPDQAPLPEAFIRAAPVTLSGEWMFEDRKYGFVPFLGRLEISPPKTGFVFDRAECLVTQGHKWWMEARPAADSKTTADLGGGKTDNTYQALEVGVITAPGGLETDEHPTFTVQVTVIWRPHKDLVAKITDENLQKVKDATEEKKSLFTEALFRAARDRVKVASNIRPRKFEELREEERIVIYRDLIRQLLEVAGISTPDDKVRHVFAEMVQAIFDVDRMLYFVAPEWWVPRERLTPSKSPQDVGLGVNKSAFNEASVVSWGGSDEVRPDNYYITEDSEPARLGSSLGWLLQLDGDNQRNAFLNAPWVKAVLPIRFGKEWDAIDWLSSDKLEGADGLDAKYAAGSKNEREIMIEALKSYEWPKPALKARYTNLNIGALTVRDALYFVVITLEKKFAASREKIVDPIAPELGYLPTDKVYEFGFKPLPGGFVAASSEPFEVFDQWVEVVPTDQIVPVSVEYDAKTGLML